MTTPIVSVAELGLALNDTSIQESRAAHLIDRAQQACANYLAQIGVSAVPQSAAFVVERIAARAYTTPTGARSAQMAAAGALVAGNSSGGGVWLTKADKADLRTAADIGSAFTINLLPDDYAVALPLWDVDGTVTQWS
jgi:hypothetical protein